MRTNVIERVEKREVEVGRLPLEQLWGLPIRKEHACTTRELARNKAFVRKGGVTMGTFRRSRRKKIFWRTSQYPLPKGLLMGFWAR